MPSAAKSEPIFVIGSSIAYIPLTQGHLALVEVDDVARISPWKWSYMGASNSTGGYAVRHKRRGEDGPSLVYMHRVLAQVPQGMQCDHRNLRKLDNRLHGNLRHATVLQNTANQGLSRRNTSGYKGVGKGRYGKNWQAKIADHGKSVYLGTRATPQAAHALYIEASVRIHGEFARGAA
jgi:hypothetical protein